MKTTMESESIKEKKNKSRRGCLRFWPLIVMPLVPVIFYLLVAFAPQVFFPFGLEHGNFKVHMRSGVPEEIIPILNRTDALLSKSDLYPRDETYDVYIINSFKLSRIMLTKNVGFGCTPFTGDVFVVKADIEKDIAYCEHENENDKRIRTLSQTIAHEVAHDMLRNYVGIERDRELPNWLKEGYCEYISEGSALEKDYALELLRKSPDAFVAGLFNFKARLMFEYLLKYEGLSVEEIINNSPDGNRVETAMLEEIRSGNEIIH